MTSRPAPRGVLHHWGSVLPIGPEPPRISLGEGDTPLVRSAHLERLDAAYRVEPVEYLALDRQR